MMAFIQTLPGFLVLFTGAFILAFCLDAFIKKFAASGRNSARVGDDRQMIAELFGCADGNERRILDLEERMRVLEERQA